MSPADIAALTDRNNCSGFGGDGWWIILLFLFGFGRNGFGGNNVGPSCATTADVQAAVDQQTLISKLDQQTYGIADATFALNNSITTGFANAELSRCNQQAALMAQLNAMATNDLKCCCETQRLTERGFADTNYNLATQACETRNLIQNSTRDVLENQNTNARAILDALNAQQIADKDAKIAEQTQTIFGLQLAASLVNQLKPCPVPAYITCNPYAAAYGATFPAGVGCGCNG
jgi:hypothetical protein